MKTRNIDRRHFLATAATAGAGLATVAARDWSGNKPTRYPDPDLISLDPRFDKYKLGNTPLQRLYTNPNTLWTEPRSKAYWGWCKAVSYTHLTLPTNREV